MKLKTVIAILCIIMMIGLVGCSGPIFDGGDSGNDDGGNNNYIGDDLPKEAKEKNIPKFPEVNLNE